jgi:hypothetical protein
MSIAGLLIVSSLSSLANVTVVQVFPGSAVVTTPAGEKLLVQTQQASSVSDVPLRRSEEDQIDYVIAPFDKFPGRNQYYETPDALHVLQVRLGQVKLYIDDNITVVYGCKKLVIDSNNDSRIDEYCIYYIMKEDDIRRVSCARNVSIVSHMITDATLVINKLIMLF